MRKILITGALGQIGSDLIPILRKKYGKNNVIATDLHYPSEETRDQYNPFIQLDVLDKDKLEIIIEQKEINTIFHMASLLSAMGEKNPILAWNININGLVNVLEAARKYSVSQIMWPSSIAAFGPSTPRENTPNETILQPSTIYGVTKVSGELLLDYYYLKHGIDGRSMRLPGIISSKTLPGGGTTDYAVAIFYEALRSKSYKCFVSAETTLPMLYMPDCIKCFIDLLEAPAEYVKRRTYNVTGMSFTVTELVTEIQKHIPEFTITYKPDFRQEIADSWPKSIDDHLAREEWGWNPKFGIEEMVLDMLEQLKKKNINN